jgi:purine-binding chemotaxis protein CheW
MNVLHVLFRVAGAEYLLAASEVLHMESFAGATKVPGTPAHVAGIMQVRGRVVPVIDLRARFGLEPQAPTQDSRVVIVQKGARAVALLADSAREVVRLDPETFRAAPELVADAGQGFVRSVAHAGNRLLMLLDLPKLIADEAEESIHG